MAEQAPSQLPTDTHLCSPDWGVYVVAIAAIAGTLYVGGGIAIGSQRGRGTRVSAHPHFSLWQELYSLVLDGMEFARSARDGGSDNSPKYMPVDAATDTVHSSRNSGRSRVKGRDRNVTKARSKHSPSSNRRTDKVLTADNQVSTANLGVGPTAPTQHESAGRTAEEDQRHARQLEERSQQGVHSSQAKVTVVGRQ